MLQKLLEERFALKLHREAREGAVYEMIIAKGEFKGTATPQGSCISPDVGLGSHCASAHARSPSEKSC